MEMPEDAKKDMAKLFDAMADLSYDERRELAGVSWKDYLETKCPNPLARAVFTVEAQLSGSAPDQISAGSRTSYFHHFAESGAVPFWYPEAGTLEDAVVMPLARGIESRGGEVLTNCGARQVMLEGGRVTGVWAHDRDSDNLLELKAPLVVLAVPICFAVGAGRLLPRDIFPAGWLSAIDKGLSLSDEDLTGIYLLKEKVIPDEYYGWIHVFNASAAGMPVYVGDWLKGDFVNATVPAGKQLVSTFITASNNTAPFGRGTVSDREAVHQALAGWENAMERAFPGFQDKIERRQVTLQLNWGRHALGVAGAEIDVRHPDIKGLFFAGDSVRNVKSLASDCVFEIAMICEEAVSAD
jgi:phytoene dehydrogenase-like protein